MLDSQVFWAMQAVAWEFEKLTSVASFQECLEKEALVNYNKCQCSSILLLTDLGVAKGSKIFNLSRRTISD